MIEPLAAPDLKRRLDEGESLVLLDVREAEEIALAPFPGAKHIALSELSVRHTELDPDAATVVICHHGIRSSNAAVGLEQLGFEKLFNLSGGVDAWAAQVDPSMVRY